MLTIAKEYVKVLKPASGFAEGAILELIDRYGDMLSVKTGHGLNTYIRKDCTTPVYVSDLEPRGFGSAKLRLGNLAYDYTHNYSSVGYSEAVTQAVKLLVECYKRNSSI